MGRDLRHGCMRLRLIAAAGLVLTGSTALGEAAPLPPVRPARATLPPPSTDAVSSAQPAEVVTSRAVPGMPLPPPRPEFTAGAQGTWAIGRVRFIGVSEIEERRAALLHLPDGSVSRVRVGSVLLGWRVARVGKTEIELVREDVRRRLSLLLP